MTMSDNGWKIAADFNPETGSLRPRLVWFDGGWNAVVMNAKPHTPGIAPSLTLMPLQEWLAAAEAWFRDGEDGQ